MLPPIRETEGTVIFCAVAVVYISYISLVNGCARHAVYLADSAAKVRVLIPTSQSAKATGHRFHLPYMFLDFTVSGACLYVIRPQRSRDGPTLPDSLRSLALRLVLEVALIDRSVLFLGLTSARNNQLEG